MGFLNLAREIFQTHDPTWADIQSLLSVLLTGEEKATVFSKAQEEADKEKEIMQAMLFQNEESGGFRVMSSTGATKALEKGLEYRG